MRRWLRSGLVLLLPSTWTPVQAADLDERGWHTGVPGARTAEVLAPLERFVLQLPEHISSRIEGPTFLFYFSPGCPHCQDAMPEIRALHDLLEDELAFLGISSASSTAEAMDAFGLAYEVPFPLVHDADASFAAAAGARSTPSVLIVQPDPEGALVTEALYPWFRGAGPLLRMGLHPEDPYAAFTPDTYIGEKVCAQCHASEARSLLLTRHTLAYRTLFLRDRAEDLECVGCHVTGLGSPSGFEVGDHSSPFTSVTCEACHSPGGPHDGRGTDPRAACEACHDAEHSLAFSVEKGLPFLDHYLVDHLDEEELRARWEALTGGLAPRPLLAFPEGPHVGSNTCRSCHKTEWKAWKRSPHREAMDRLAAEEAGQVDCVRCHASPVRYGPASPDLEGYVVHEGVGCESCHGSGEAHLADPVAGTILGLGESCPECVLEAVCTTCHTAAWDPGWDLHPRLRAIEH